MKYSYKTPEEAIISLENAYSNNDISAIIASKDFETEALLFLEQASYDYDLTDEVLIKETAKLLEVNLIQSLVENGFPNFNNLERVFFNLQKFRGNIYVIEERIIYSDGTFHNNRIFIINKNDEWKVVTADE